MIGDAIQLARPELPPLEQFADALGAIWDRALVSNFATAARDLERICADYTGLPLARTVANADLGLTLAVTALGLPAGTRAVVPSFTFPSTLHALVWNGLTPVFADVDAGTWCLTPDSIAAALDPAPGLIAGTHAFMSACDADGLEEVAARTGAALVFDAAQAYGTWFGDRHAGAFGDASVFSFSATKVVTCGEGGLAMFRDPDVAARFERLRSYGIKRDYEVLQPGLNAKLTELHAALGCLTVPHVEAAVAARLALADRYRERLGGTFGMQVRGDRVRPTPTQLVVDAGERRDAAADALAAERVETRTYFRPLHLMPAFADVERGPLEVTERLGRSLLTLPLHGGMTVADVDRVCDVLLTVR